MTDTTEMTGRTPRLRHIVIGLAGALVVGVAVVVAIGRVAGFTDVRHVLDGADPAWLTCCLVGQVVVFAGYAGAMRRSIEFDGGVAIPIWASLRLVLAGFAATQVFAFAGAGGLAINYWVLRRVGLSRDAAAIRLIALNTSVYLVFAGIGWIAAALAGFAGAAPAGVTVPWLVGVPAIALAGRWFTAPRRVAHWTTARSEGLLPRALATGVAATYRVRRSLQTADGRRVFGWAAVYWVGDILSLWAALRAFGAQPGITVVCVAYTTGYLVQSLPIPLIATGGMDAATTFLLHLLGVPLETALVAVVAHRLFAFWLPVVPGSICALTAPRIVRGIPVAASYDRAGQD